MFTAHITYHQIVPDGIQIGLFCSRSILEATWAQSSMMLEPACTTSEIRWPCSSSSFTCTVRQWLNYEY